MPREGRPVIPGLGRIEVEHLREAMRPGIGDRRHREWQHGGDRGQAKIHQRQDQDGEHGHLDLLRLDLLADIFGRAADHQTGDEHGEDDEEQHAVDAGADAANDDLAELDIDERYHPAERREAESCMELTAPQEAAVVDHREQARDWQCRSGPPCPPCCRRIEPKRGEVRVARPFRPIANDHKGEEDDPSRRDRPALALVLDHAAEDVRQRGADQQDLEDLEEIGQRRWVLERMREHSH